MLYSFALIYIVRNILLYYNKSTSITTDNMDNPSEKIISQIIKYCPILKRYFGLNTTLKEYSEQLYSFSADEVHIHRQEPIKDVIRAECTRIHGRQVAHSLEASLRDGLAINLADHHQLLNHPMLITSNIIGNSHTFCAQSKQPPIVVFSSGDVPPNNIFSKNGFQLSEKRIPLFSNSEKEYSTCCIPKRDFNFVEQLQQIGRWHKFTQEEQSFLINEQQKIQSYDFSKCRDYVDQIKVIVKNTWPYLFEEALRPMLPDLLYVTQEEVTAHSLLRILEEDTIMSRSLFDARIRDLVLKTFSGIVIAWRENEQKGTHFFWRKHPERPSLLRMWVQGNSLVPADPRFKSYAVDLTPESITAALRAGEIVPSLFTIFSVLIFYAGIKPLVGYGSLVYLDKMKKAWIDVHSQLGNPDEAALVRTINTGDFIAGLPLLYSNENKTMRRLYAYDIIFRGGITNDHLQKVLSMKYSDILRTAIPDLYRYYSQKYIPKKEHLDTSSLHHTFPFTM